MKRELSFVFDTVHFNKAMKLTQVKLHIFMSFFISEHFNIQKTLNIYNDKG